eukprot:scaffold11166_cov58-Phaeocystis_antarctica.AAC.4
MPSLERSDARLDLPALTQGLDLMPSLETSDAHLDLAALTQGLDLMPSLERPDARLDLMRPPDLIPQLNKMPPLDTPPPALASF